MLKSINDLRTYYIGLTSEVTVKSHVFPQNRILFKGIDYSKFYLTGKSVSIYLYETSIIAN